MTSPTAPSSGLYLGTVRHHRLRPRTHRLTYRVFSLLLDLDEVRETRLFSHNRLNVLSFHDKDHGDSQGKLRDWVNQQLAQAGQAEPDRVRILCYPRLWGVVFNPLTIYFCEDTEGHPTAILYEVNNTFGQRHHYLFVLSPDARAGELLTHTCDKEFYVSPFIPMNMTYHFRVAPPAEAVSIAIQETDDQGDFLFASFTGRHKPLTDAEITKAVAKHPLMTAKVIVGIHWEALKLWRKGAIFHHRPNPPSEPLRIINIATSNN